MNDTFTIALDDQIDVRQRLQQLCQWQEEWRKEDSHLAQRIQKLDDTQLPRFGPKRPRCDVFV